MTESNDQLLSGRAPDNLTRDAGALQQLTSTRYLPVTMAVVTSVLFGIGSTMLGIAAARTARPCPADCPPLSVDQLALALMVVGPGVVTALTSGASILRARRGRGQAWVCAVLGCVGSVLCVLFGSLSFGIA